MLNVKSLKEYRLLRGLSLRDVARYCDVSFQMISAVETGLYGLTESTYKEIVKGINRASQAKARGTFEADKEKEKKLKEKEKAAKEEAVKNTKEEKTMPKRSTARTRTKKTK